MKKLLIAMLLSLTCITSPSRAQSDIIMLDGESPGSTGIVVINALAENLRLTNKISAGNCNNATRIYEVNEKPVLYMFFNDYWLSKELGRHTCGNPVTQDNIMFIGSMAQAVCKKASDTPANINDFKKANRFGFPTPHDFWKNTLNSMNLNAHSNLKPVPYTTGGQVVTGLLSGEIDYAVIAMSRAVPMMKEGTISCFAKFGPTTALLPGIRTFLPNFKYGDYEFSYVAISKNLNTLQRDTMRKDIQELLIRNSSFKEKLDSMFFTAKVGEDIDLWREYLRLRKTFRDIYTNQQ